MFSTYPQTIRHYFFIFSPRFDSVFAPASMAQAIQQGTQTNCDGFKNQSIECPRIAKN
jgi:hypothetical protein